MNSALGQKINELLERLSKQQKFALVGVSAVAVFALIMLFVWANRPEYALLYSKLDAADSSKILEDLKDNSIDYRLKDGGRSIFVTKEDVHELRIKYAGQNMISSGKVGYELFDKNNLGLTDFMQRINLKRALEGELSNTINQIESIEQSRVHLVIPEQTLFTEDEKKSTASVVLKLKPQTSLDRKQVAGITNLVAASVEGLETENVIILDTFGRVLTKNEPSDNDIGLSSSQYELQKSIENHLGQKAQTMLDKVLGANNSIIRVSAVLNFEKLTRTSEKVDPDIFAVVSEEKNEETTINTDTTTHKRENAITNYELNKVVEHFQNSIGDIKQLSIAVFVNKPDTSLGQSVRGPAEIAKISDIVKNAVGFSEERNDKISVEEFLFDRSILDRENEMMSSIEERETLTGYLKIGFGVVAALTILVLLRTLLKKLGLDDYIKHQRDLLLQEAEDSLDEAAEKKELSALEKQRRLAEDAKARVVLQERVREEVREFSQDTDRTTRILRYWLVDDEEY